MHGQQNIKKEIYQQNATNVDVQMSSLLHDLTINCGVYKYSVHI